MSSQTSGSGWAPILLLVCACGSSTDSTVLSPPVPPLGVTDAPSPLLPEQEPEGAAPVAPVADGTEGPSALDGDGPALLPAGCGPGVLTASGTEHLGRRPYLQDVTTTSALVLFTTREADVSPVLTLEQPRPLARSAGELALTASRSIETELDPADSTGHQRFARLTALQPDTAYCYQLDDWTEPVGFRTPPLPGTNAPVRFVAIGDSGGPTRDVVRAAVEHVPFELMLHMGDIAYPSATLANLETKFFDTYANVLGTIPVFPASGNHEYYAGEAAPYRQVFALPENGTPDGLERWFSFNWGNIHFVALDTELVGPQQAAWLDQDLAQNTQTWTIAYMHRPPYSSGTHGGAANVRDTFSPLFEKHAVPLVLSGHDHDYERTHPINGVTYVVTGGGGQSVRPVGTSEFTVKSASIFHFVQVEVGSDTIDLRAIDTDGNMFDEVTIPLTRP